MTQKEKQTRKFSNPIAKWHLSFLSLWIVLSVEYGRPFDGYLSFSFPYISGEENASCFVIIAIKSY
jgi:hypothetical protein